jgi:phosphoribosylaminoimidazolecarboxamide formyltransferase/IMP cyclohydrolase
MSELKKISKALVSVYNKDGLESILSKLHADGVQFISTGGTQAFIESLGYPCQAVESLTSYPSIFGGRVKTLHPKVFGGILYRRDNEGDLAQASEYEIPAIDLVIVDLYPFTDTVASGAPAEDIIEKIDIGGISLIRAAAKNYKDTVIVASKAQYSIFEDMITRNGGAATTEAERRQLATAAFSVSSAYDSAIYSWFNETEPEQTGVRIAVDGVKSLRYGENPHQNGAFYGDFDAMFDKLHGKEVSYNNLLDIDAAVALINELDGTSVAILKHNNACGVATRSSLLDAWRDALAGDPVSAFGGIIIANKPIDAKTAEEINKIFFEVIIAPEYEADALAILEQKKNRIILRRKPAATSTKTVRTILNGVLVQDRDLKVETPEDLKQVTGEPLTDAQIADLLFANKIVKHSKSNAIVLARNGQLLASGVGQTSRVDALRHAIEKAKSFGFDLKGAALASDAFFPFSDCVEIAHAEGITTIIQPGGSIRDNDSIEYCREHNIAMAMTGIRHFRH